MPTGLTPTVDTTPAWFAAGSIRISRESRHPRNMAPAPAAISSQPLGVAMRADTRPVDGSIRSTARGSTVQTDPSPTARFCAPSADVLAEKTFGIRSVTWPSGEICHSELPLLAHNEPKPATRSDGCGTSTERGPGAGVGGLELVATDVGATDPDEPGGEEDVVVHAVS